MHDSYKLMGSGFYFPFAKSLTLSILVTFFTISARATIISDVLYPEPNRPIFVQIFQDHSSTSKPTFFLLPGINRSWLHADRITREMRSHNSSYVVINFSPHAFSVAQLKDAQIGKFELRHFSLNDLVDEIRFVQNYLINKYQIKRLLTVSLSYSGLISPYLDDELIIDTSPMTSAAAAYPDFESYRQWLKSLELMNPVFGPFWTRSQLDFSIVIIGQKKLMSLLRIFNFPNPRELK